MIAFMIAGACLAALLVGLAAGRRLESRERHERDRLLDEADHEIAALHALDRIHARGDR